jgi:hypothetical protein
MSAILRKGMWGLVTFCNFHESTGSCTEFARKRSEFQIITFLAETFSYASRFHSLPLRKNKSAITDVGFVEGWKDNHLLHLYTIINCRYTEHTDELSLKSWRLQVVGAHRPVEEDRPFISPSVCVCARLSLSLMLRPTVSRPVGQSVLE